MLMFLFCFAKNKVLAQENHFTQFDYSPLVTNPANTGNFTGDWRIAINYRNQWQGINTPFQTAAISFDKQMYIFNQKFGAGLYLLSDESGENGLNFYKVYGSLGYNNIFNDNLIGIGLQAGYVSGKVNTWEVYNPLTGMYDLPNGEPLSDYRSNYLDFNLGLIYKRSINILEPEIGLSLFHLNNPNTSFYEGSSDGGKESVGLMAYTMIKAKLGDSFYLTPKFMLAQRQSYEATIAGLEAGYQVVGSRTLVKRIFGGAYINNGIINELDAYSFQFGATINRIDIALNYNLTTSNLSNYGSMGAFEVSLIYKSISTVLNSYSIPCERY
jgi:type IX secretion system PorP/SprF family membrane protein